LRIPAFLLVAALAATSVLHAQDMRSRFRIVPRCTKITQAQAEELTLTVTQVAVRDVQTWVRASGTIDKTAKIITTFVSGPDAALVKVGQRARTFPVTSRYSMYQAFVVSVTPQNGPLDAARGGGVKVGVEIAATGRANTKDYVVEIVTTRGDFLSIPNEAIIEEGTSQVVYVKTPGGDYQPQTIQTGIQGELYTQVLGGVKEGNEVVTFGSFFIDSDYKLKGTTTAASK
jgi:hypothetical protein